MAKQMAPTSIKFETSELEVLQYMAEKLGLPLSVFVKMVLRLESPKLYEAMTGEHVTFDAELQEEIH
jgi:hypothetical protein